MRALLSVAHGSRRVSSNDEVRNLAEQLRSRAGSDFGYVTCAFLELADPSIPEGLEQCQQAGAKQVVVLPYFLSAGRHVAEDIPEIVRRFSSLHPRIQIEVAPYLGRSSKLADTLLELVKL